MSNVNYTNAPPNIADAINKSVQIDDGFLPSPEYFAEKLAKEKISLNIDAETVIKFRIYAKEHGLKYQALMNQVLSAYAQKRL
ncbi:MAG: BrnA antitoxin family protein [Oscillospiraceae bacterium]|nr:BrnA antitoxin family protein [Oscillospiraceae bacterium]